MASSSQFISLTPFETYMLLDDCPEHPMSIVVELRFDSPLNEVRLREALAYATHRNPLLACKLDVSDGKYRWRYDASFKPDLHIQPDSARFPVVGGRLAPLNLQAEGGLRVWYYPSTVAEDIGSSGEVTSTPTSLLVFQFHHALVDGIGVRCFMLDFLGSYADSSLQVSKAVDFASLDYRADFAAAVAKQSENPIGAWRRIKNAYYFHFQPPKSIEGNREKLAKLPPNASGSECSPIKSLIFDREVSDQILSKVKKAQVHLNDLALSLLFSTCADWLDANSNAKARDRIRIMFPYDLRTKKDLRMPAANKLSFAFLGRRMEQCRDSERLLKGIADEVADIKRTVLPLDLLNAFKALAKRPALMRLAIAGHQRMATAVQTYTGDISRGLGSRFPQAGSALIVGDARLTQVLAAPPTRRNTNIALGLSVNWRQICISALWNRSILAHEDCESFLRLYLQKWHDWLGAS